MDRITSLFDRVRKYIVGWRKNYVQFSWFDKLTLYSFWILVAFGLTAAYWKVFDTKFPLDIYEIQTAHPYVLPGDMIIINRAGCIRKEKTIMVERQIVDTVVYNLPVVPSVTNDHAIFKKGACFSLDYLLTVPKIPEAQEYRYQSHMKSRINPFTVAEADLPAFEFTMIDRDDPIQMKYREEYLKYVESIIANAPPVFAEIEDDHGKYSVFANRSRISLIKGSLPDNFYSILVTPMNADVIASADGSIDIVGED